MCVRAHCAHYGTCQPPYVGTVSQVHLAKANTALLEETDLLLDVIQRGVSSIFPHHLNCYENKHNMVNPTGIMM